MNPNPTWSGLVRTEDTALAATDSGGPGLPVVYLNGAYADSSHWRRVIAELGPTWRHLTFDARARGRSHRSADYSFAGAVRDLTAVLAARGVHRPLLVGWSHGAAVGVEWGLQHPDRVLGVVSVDGAMPTPPMTEEFRARIYTLFRRFGPFLPLVRPFGLSARMSWRQHAEVNEEINEIFSNDYQSVLARVSYPLRYVKASGGNLGGSEQEMAQFRGLLDAAIAGNPNIRVSATAPSNHSKILARDFRALAGAVRELATELEQDPLTR